MPFYAPRSPWATRGTHDAPQEGHLTHPFQPDPIRPHLLHALHSPDGPWHLDAAMGHLHAHFPSYPGRDIVDGIQVAVRRVRLVGHTLELVKPSGARRPWPPDDGRGAGLALLLLGGIVVDLGLTLHLASLLLPPGAVFPPPRGLSEAEFLPGLRARGGRRGGACQRAEGLQLLNQASEHV